MSVAPQLLRPEFLCIQVSNSFMISSVCTPKFTYPNQIGT